MTEHEAPGAAEPTPAAAPEPPPGDVSPPPPPLEPSLHPPPARPARDALLPWLCGFGFLVLAGAIGLVWWSLPPPQPPQSQASGSVTPADLQALADRLARLEQRPAAAGATSADLVPLAARIATLEQRTAPDLAALEARVAALEQRAAPDLTSLEARVVALEKQATGNGSLTARVDALSGRVDALAQRDQGAVSDLGRRLDTDEARLGAQEHATALMTATAQRAAVLARIQAAQAALAAGQPVGDLPNAPPAVARFAADRPPTEASLRLAYPAAEHAALAASRPDVDEKPFLARVLAHAEDLVTVRQGDRVLLGDPAAGVLARARTALDAGDLAGAVASIATLSGSAAAAMSAWADNAKAFLAAREGLADMAAHA
jgi:hypothetical protein